MKLNFNLDAITKVSEFCIGREGSGQRRFVVVPADRAVIDELEKMVRRTWDGMAAHEDGCVKYEPSNKYASKAWLYVPLVDEMVVEMRNMHGAANLPSNAKELSTDPNEIYCYFVRLTDNQGQKLTAVRRASYFKAVSKRPLIQVFDDSVVMVTNALFKLDHDFDLLIDSEHVHILRLGAFESIGRLSEAILSSVPDNISFIKEQLPFIELGSIESYARTHIRAARYLASICAQENLGRIDMQRLLNQCVSTEVKAREVEGKLVIDVGAEMNFLQVLDRRRYGMELVMDKPEIFVAGSRKKA